MIWWLILWIPLAVFALSVGWVMFWYLVLLIGSIIIHVWLAIKETCLFIVDDLKHRMTGR
jgi:hypothetical protein